MPLVSATALGFSLISMKIDKKFVFFPSIFRGQDDSMGIFVLERPYPTYCGCKLCDVLPLRYPVIGNGFGFLGLPHALAGCSNAANFGEMRLEGLDEMRENARSNEMRISSNCWKSLSLPFRVQGIDHLMF